MNYTYFFVILIGFSCTITQKTEVPTLSYSELKPLLHKEGNKTYVVNFWATWCAPCIKELPYFEAINQKKNVEVLLVSLDFPKHKESRLLPFIKKKQLQSKVVLLDDSNENLWINAIDSTWSGAIPATIIYNQNKRMFYEQSFTEDELNQIINTF
ncbi:MAG: TlpA disulfide reductase family protein [Bacteroidetes bacterium]|nr:TlpA disulfide reductase family protein [Bacteroidota bacterium]MDA0888079.1 TlpA disulfide reductase family protein [Bacteroidota bacterium]MDA1084032.1 TlpA disulfide reductase family protein [Bacteroidota bacterium]